MRDVVEIVHRDLSRDIETGQTSSRQVDVNCSIQIHLELEKSGNLRYKILETFILKKQTDHHFLIRELLKS